MIKLEYGNCLELMKSIPDKSIDMVLADLPYGITHAKWDSVIPLRPLWKQYKRIITDHGCIALFGTEPFTSNLIMSNLKMFRYNWIWHKTAPTQFLNAHRRPLSIHENISIFYKHLPTYHPQMKIGDTHNTQPCGSQSLLYDKYKNEKDSRRSISTYYGGKLNQIKGIKTNKYYPVDVINFASSKSKRLHPTQKPINLLRYLIKTYTNKGDLVLDNVMGSGSTGVACKQLNRDFIGIELDNHYFKIAKNRINKAQDKELVSE